MEPSATLDHSTQRPDATDDHFTQVAKAGWNGFTRFLLLNVIVTIVILLIIGLFTVWW
jgi:hypothetical protein